MDLSFRLRLAGIEFISPLLELELELEGKKGAINIKQILQAYDSILIPLFEENCVLLY